MMSAGLAQKPMLDALASDDATEAANVLDDAMHTPHGELPAKLHAFTGLLLADRGAVMLSANLPRQATDDFGVADKLLDLKDMELDDIMRKTAMPRTMRHGFHMGWLAALNYPYVPRLHERLMVNALSMLAYLDLGDDANARVEARRLEVMVDFARRTSPYSQAVRTRAFSGILAGFAFDRGDQTDDAMRSYEEARLAATTDVSPLTGPIPPAPRGEILIVIAYGLVPRPNPDSASPEHPIYELMSGVEDSTPAFIGIDGEEKKGIEVLNLAEVVREDWDEATKEMGGNGTPLSWAALPSRYVALRVPVDAGKHRVKLSARGVTRETDLLVPPASYAATSLFVMH